DRVGLDDDGDFGEATAKALRAFQRSRKLRANGIVDASTWHALGTAVPPRGPVPAPRPKQPSEKRLRGFDVSDVRGDVDFAQGHAAGIDFAIVRVSDGDVHDTRYGPGRIKALRESGLAWFPYYFGRVASQVNNQRNGTAEAAMAIKFARAGGWGRKSDLP